MTYISAAIYPGLPNKVPNKSWDLARWPNEEYTYDLICILMNTKENIKKKEEHRKVKNSSRL